MSHPIENWFSLYGEGWREDIVPEAFSHPAKFARGLIRRIYAEMIARGWVSAGDVVIDPFGGVALGALDAQLNGLQWVGCELEPKFHALGNANLELWRTKYAPHFARWGSAVLLQGDSRRLREVLSEAGMLRRVPAVLSSPPFEDCNVHVGSVGDTLAMRQQITNGTKRDESYGTSPGQIGSMPPGEVPAAVVSSPPYTGDALGHDAGAIRLDANEDERRAKHGSGRRPGYGLSGGQLGAMPEGSAVVSSPPFLQSSGGVNVTQAEGPLSDSSLVARHAAGNAAAEAYGAEDGQLGNMEEGEVEGVVSSPPYEGLHNQNAGGSMRDVVPMKKHGGGDIRPRAYSDSAENLGNDSGETFWSASRLILQECYALLKPGGTAAWVLKDYVRGGKRVPFCDNWRRLCESVGFVTVMEVRAWVVEDNGTQLAMLDESNKAHRKERKSFFRRLAEKKGSPRIDWETVLFVQKVKA